MDARFLRIAELLTPPDFSSEVPTVSQWDSARKRMGGIPEDFVEFVSRYGTGCVDGFLWFFNPASGNPYLNLLAQIEKQGEVLRSIAEDPSTGDLFRGEVLSRRFAPFAVSDNGDLLLWSKRGERAHCSVAVIPAREESIEWFEMTPVEFLVGLLSKNVSCYAFPEDFPSERPKFLPESTGGSR